MVDSKEGTVSNRSCRKTRNRFRSCDGCSFFYIIHFLTYSSLIGSGRGNCNIISTVFTGVFLLLFA